MFHFNYKNLDMETARVNIIARFLLLVQIPAAFLHTVVSGQYSVDSAVVAVYNISAPAGSEAVLQCHSQRMVWTQDRLKDRQRVVHWDLFRSGPDYTMERVLDMFSSGDQRIYNAYDKERVSMSQTAFDDGNFSLYIKAVKMSDRGIYSCNLHHHYCHLYETTKVQLNVTKSRRKERHFWDGEKVVMVVLLGSAVVLPCDNRQPVWTESHGEEDQQVVHWDRQLPGVRHDRADRVIDLYASGERRQYGPLFLRRKMNITADAFSQGDFSLTIANLQLPDQGVYSCHLHHHYCGLDERRVFHLTVGPPSPAAPAAPRLPDLAPPPPPLPNLTSAPRVLPHDDPNTNVVEVPRVINVIVPEHRGHFLQQMGYILATILMLALIAVILFLLSRRWKKRALEYDLRRSERGHMTANDFEMGATELKMCNQEEMRRDYKNNLLKEKAELCKLPSPKVIDLDKEMDKTAWK